MNMVQPQQQRKGAMFASSQYPMPARGRVDPPASTFGEGEGHWCEASHAATRALLFPQGRPGAWLLLLAGSCVYVLFEAVLLRLP
jgi:hypothetical protein